MNRGFFYIWSCILICYVCLKNMNFGGFFDLFKKFGFKFEDEGLFYSFQNKFFFINQDDEMLN